MNTKITPWIATAALAACGLSFTTADAQFGGGFSNLPQNDFTWTWGDPGDGRGIDDFSVLGNEGGFRCELTGKLRAGGRMSRFDVREIEDQIRSSQYFVSAATNAMNDLDARRQLEWATLSCERPQRRQRNREEREEN